MLRQNGISRKTIFISRVIVNITVALGMSVIDKVLCLLFKAIGGSIEGIEFASLFEVVYKDRLNGMSNMLINLEDIGLSLAINLAFLFIGYFITIMFYRLSKPGKAIVGAGVPVFFYGSTAYNRWCLGRWKNTQVL